MLFVHNKLGWCALKCASLAMAKGFLLVAKRTPFALQLSLRCIAIVLILHTKKPPFALQWGLNGWNIWLRTLWKRMISPNEFSRINFLFVTLFYCLDDICRFAIYEFWVLNCSRLRLRFWIVQFWIGCLRQFWISSFELFSATPAILNCTILNCYKRGRAESPKST